MTKLSIFVSAALIAAGSFAFPAFAEQSSQLQTGGKVQSNALSQTTPAANGSSGSQVQMYRERQLQPTVMDAPPAWAQGSLSPSTGALLAPFGANMFRGNFSGTYSDGMNGNYVIMTGDRIEVRIWGVKTYSDVLTVDQQGNIFLPEIGPIHVAGVHQDALQGAVKGKVSSVFTGDVNVYANLQSAQPVAVYVTGYVASPGRYAGGTMDSVMSYLDRAGGIVPEAGSFRKIQIKRGTSTVATLDLYDFVMSGVLPNVRLKDGDVILVGERGTSVAAYGLLRQEARYEFRGDTSGAQLIRFAGPLPGATHVSISGVRSGRPMHRYMTVDEFKAFSLSDGDSVEFVTDVRGSTIMASVSGAIRGESRFPITSSTTLKSLLAHVEIDPGLADINAVYVRRHSVAQQQKKTLQDSMQRLEQSVLTASSSTNEESEIRVKEAELIHDFVTRASQLEPDGVVVVSRGGKLNDLLLEDGDMVVIPQKSDVVQVSGEVMLPKAVAFDKDMDADDYVKSAGGFSERANKRDVLVARMNGEVGPIKEMGIHPGDSILVMPKVETKNLELAKGMTQILYQIAVATKVAVGL